MRDHGKTVGGGWEAIMGLIYFKGFVFIFALFPKLGHIIKIHRVSGNFYASKHYHFFKFYSQCPIGYVCLRRVVNHYGG